MSNNYTLHNQWSTRPDDERYSTLTDMAQYLTAESEQSRTIQADTDMLRVVPIDGNGLGLIGKSGNPAHFTNWSLNQVCQVSSSPASYLRSLPSTLAADCLNYGLRNAGRQGQQLYLRQKPANGEPAYLELRALTSPGYSRVLSAHIVDRLSELQRHYPDWQAPMVYPRGDFGGQLEPCVGFASDRDVYLCLQNTHVTIDSPTGPLHRGIMITNSEVGAKRLDVTLFLFERICGNYIIWGMRTIAQIHMRHYGEKIRRSWQGGLTTTLREASTMSAREETDKIASAARKELGPSRQDVIDLLFKRDIATKQQLNDAYDATERYAPMLNPRSAFGMLHGLTRISQLSPYADERLDLDRSAAKVLDL